MKNKWKPSKSKRRAFAIKMQDPDFADSYLERKDKKAAVRRSGSRFDYSLAGGRYIPTKIQRDAAFKILSRFFGTEIEIACQEVIFGYENQEKVHHDHIHIINETIRQQTI